MKEQWEKDLKKIKLDQNVKVFVVKGLVQNIKSISCDLLVLDELHLFAADTFVKTFQIVKYKWPLGLTATLERLDGKHKLLEQYCPIVDKISQKEAIEKGWINNFLEFNVPVHLSRKDIQNQNQLNKDIRYYMRMFPNFDTLLACGGNIDLCRDLSLINGKDPSQIRINALNGMRKIRERTSFYNNLEAKHEAANKILNELQLKTIVFSESTEFANALYDNNRETSVLYHSYIKSEIREEIRSKPYKTEKGVENALKKALEQKKNAWIEDLTLKWTVNVNYGPSTLKKEAMRCFKDRRYKKDVIITAKALDQGFNAKDLELGIDCSRTRNPTQRTQRTGRIARVYTYKDGSKKVGIYINLYVPDYVVPGSIDERKLREYQKNAEPIWVDSVEELFEYLNKEFNGKMARV